MFSNALHWFRQFLVRTKHLRQRRRDLRPLRRFLPTTIDFPTGDNTFSADDFCRHSISGKFPRNWESFWESTRNPRSASFVSVPLSAEQAVPHSLPSARRASLDRGWWYSLWRWGVTFHVLDVSRETLDVTPCRTSPPQGGGGRDRVPRGDPNSLISKLPANMHDGPQGGNRSVLFK